MSYNKARRRTFSKAQRQSFLVAHGSICYFCGETILEGSLWHVEHLIAREIMPDGEADRDGNLRPIHADPCHKTKTAADRKAIAKSNRLRKKFGLDPITRKHKPKPIPSRPMQSAKRAWPKRKFGENT